MRRPLPFALCVALTGCIADGFGPDIDWGSGPLTGHNATAVVGGLTRSSLEGAVQADYVRAIGVASTADLFLVGPNAYLGRSRVASTSTYLMVPIRNASSEARCFIEMKDIALHSGARTLAGDEGIFLTGSVGVHVGVPSNTCLAPTEQGWILTYYSGVSIDSVDDVTYSTIAFDPGEQDARWQQAAATLIPTGASAPSGVLTVDFENQGRQGAEPNVTASVWLVLGTGGTPLVFGFFSHVDPAGVIGIGESARLLDEDLFSGYLGPVEELQVYVGFTDEALIDR